MAVRLTHKEFSSELYNKNIFYRNDEFFLLSEYKGMKKEILIKNKYGVLKTTPKHLLKGINPTITSALDKNSYFKNIVLSKNKDIKILSNYTSANKKIIFSYKGKLHCMIANSILKGNKPSVESALNKEFFIVDKFKEIHDKYLYPKFKYKNSKQVLDIICKKHGKFKQSIDMHLQGKGCPKCKSEYLKELNMKNPTGWSYSSWEKAAYKSKRFDSFKVYIIKCWNENEEFYKIGRTFLSINDRFYGKNNLPYKYKIIKTIQGDPIEICKLENILKKQHNKYTYLPKLYFNGKHECYSKLNKKWDH